MLTDFLNAREEERYVRYFGRLHFGESMTRGKRLRRQILSYGAAFRPNFQSLQNAAPLTKILRELRDQALRACNRTGEFRQALLQRFPPGSSISYHRDSDVFGAPIIGISFAGQALLRFRDSTGQRAGLAIAVPPRSLYILDGQCRETWLHSIAPVEKLRYSVTFRTLRRAPNQQGRP